jgi:hypothetical protein
MQNLKLIKAKKFGIICLLLLLVEIAVLATTYTIFDEKNLLQALIVCVFTLVILYTYLEMLKGIEFIAEESKNQNFIKNYQSFKIAIIITGIYFAFSDLVDVIAQNEIISFAVLILTLLTFLYLGIVSLFLAKSFSELDATLTKYAKQAAFWNKLSGVLFVSVLFGVFGALTSLIADFYMWKVISEKLKQ